MGELDRRRRGGLLTDGGSTKAIESNQRACQNHDRQDMEQAIIPDTSCPQSM